MSFGFGSAYKPGGVIGPMKSFGSRWVYTMKRNEAGVPVKHKARFVAKGYSQQFGFDVFSETWAFAVQALGRHI